MEIVASTELVHSWHYVNICPRRDAAKLWSCQAKRLVNFVDSASVVSGYHGDLEPAFPNLSFGASEDSEEVEKIYGQEFGMTFRYKGPSHDDNWFMVRRMWEHIDRCTYISWKYTRSDIREGGYKIVESPALMVLEGCYWTDVAPSENHFAWLEALRARPVPSPPPPPPPSGGDRFLRTRLALSWAARGGLTDEVFPQEED